MNFKNKKILIIAPHPDDETLAVGGTIARAKDEGAKVFVIVFTAGTEKQYGSDSRLKIRLKEFAEAMKILGVDGYEFVYKDKKHLKLDTLPTKELIDFIEKSSNYSLNRLSPDVFIFPGKSYNQDHDAVNRACVTATRPYPPSLKPSPSLVLVYSHFDEQVWNYDLPLMDISNFHVDISDFLEVKKKAISCYKSQLKNDCRHWRTLNGILEINKLYGKKVGVYASEEFLCLRYVA